MFLPSKEQITRFCKDLVKQIETLRENAPPPLSIIPLYSSLPFELQEKIYVPAPPGKSSRRCIVSSDLAETCLATENIRFVIDSGFSKQRVYNSVLGVESSLITPVSRLKAMIRAQRAGKVSLGMCFRLYTMAAYESELTEEHQAEILRSDLLSTLLILKKKGIDDFKNLETLDNPSPDQLRTLLEDLKSLGALNEEVTDVS